MAASHPFVRVVVINFDGWQLTIDCLRSILASDWPDDRLEIVLVDNGSVDDVVARVRTEMPVVRIIEPLDNTGFARGCNLGLQAPGSFDLVALVNNDATVDSGWLRPLVERIDESARVGAVCPKMLFSSRYLEATLDVPAAAATASDGRTLGARVNAVRVDGARADGRVAFDEGFFLAETPNRTEGDEIARWSWRRGHVRVRADGQDHPTRLAIRVTAPQARNVSLATRAESVSAIVGTAATWLAVDLDDERFDVINNAGSSLYPDGFGGDRGFLERDRGQYDEPSEVFAWCGGAVLLSPGFLEEVGLFDERLFLYYEDTDLSWRGRLRGWKYIYEPRSVVRHHHGAAAGAESEVFRYQTARNRPLTLAKNAPARLAWSAGMELVRRGVGATVRDLVFRPLTLRMPNVVNSAHDRAVLWGYLRLLPAMLRDRWKSGRVMRREAILAWTETKDIAR